MNVFLLPFGPRVSVDPCWFIVKCGNRCKAICCSPSRPLSDWVLGCTLGPTSLAEKPLLYKRIVAPTIDPHWNLSKLKPKTQENIKTLTDLHDDSSCSYFLHAHVIQWCHCTEGYLLGYQASDVKRTPFGIVPIRSNWCKNNCRLNLAKKVFYILVNRLNLVSDYFYISLIS